MYGTFSNGLGLLVLSPYGWGFSHVDFTMSRLGFTMIRLGFSSLYGFY